MKSLRLAKDLTLPLDFVSRTAGILAVRGAGKSNTASVIAEEMFAAGLPFCVIDPVGSWYGLRSCADGLSAGLPIPIFGGKHGDVPLERGAGELVADLIVEKRLTCVLDLSRFDSEADKKHFLLAFARRLYQRNENPLHLFLEEADDYIPQSPMGDEKLLLRAWENIVRRGRARGLGMTLITQRSAAIAKMVLTQVETLFAMRTTGPQDIAAIEAWIKYHQVGKDVLSSLASLEDGEAWVWSPHYLKTMSRHQIRRRQTFDSGATPKNVRAKDARPPATLADIDLTALQERMAATIEKAKADDPKELRKELARVKEALQTYTVSTMTRGHAVERPVLTDLDRARLEQLGHQITLAEQQMHGDLVRANELLREGLAKVAEYFTERIRIVTEKAQSSIAEQFAKISTQKILGKLAAVQDAQRDDFLRTGVNAVGRAPATIYPKGNGTGQAVPPIRQPSGTKHVAMTDGSPLPPGEHAVLTATLQYQQHGLERMRLGILTGYKRSSRDAYVARLAQKGLVELRGGLLYPTAAGRTAMNGQYEPLPTGHALIGYWRNRLPEGERVLFDTILSIGGGSGDVMRDIIDERTGYKRSSRDAYLTRLKARGLVEFSGRGTVRASEHLFT